MKAQHVFFPKIMNGASQFVIPVFQRDYSWTEARTFMISLSIPRGWGE